MAYVPMNRKKSAELQAKINKEETNPMRNLKKLLALVLAMMMALSLMVTANAANPVRDYPDIDQADEAFEEAIDVLTGMKVYSGDNGNLKPASTITRAEGAVLILCYIAYITYLYLNLPD